MVYLPEAIPPRQRMSSPSRIRSLSAGRRRRSQADRESMPIYKTVALPQKGGAKVRRAIELAPAAPSADLAMRLRRRQRAIRSLVEGREVLVELIGAVNSTLEPEKVAELVIDRAARWIPAPCWAVVASNSSGELVVSGSRGL